MTKKETQQTVRGLFYKLHYLDFLKHWHPVIVLLFFTVTKVKKQNNERNSR